MNKVTIQKFVILSIVFSLVTVAFAWICPMVIGKMDSMTSSMVTNQQLPSCTSQTTHNNCALAYAEQIAHMQQVVFMTPQLEQILSLIFAIAALLLASYLVYITKLLLSLYRRHWQDSPNLKQFDYLFLAFSKGIVHPKLYY